MICTIVFSNRYVQNPSTPVSPLDPGVEMFSKGRPTSIVPIDYKLANGLSVVPEIPTPQTTGFQHETGLYSVRKARPVSQVTEIDEWGSENEFEEESEETINREFVS
jgi:hypothetical protein